MRAHSLTQVGRHALTPRAPIGSVQNRRYREYQYADDLKPGDPRTAGLTAKIDFRTPQRPAANRGRRPERPLRGEPRDFPGPQKQNGGAASFEAHSAVSRRTVRRS